MLFRIVVGYLLIGIHLRLDGIARAQGWLNWPVEWTVYPALVCVGLILFGEWARR